MNLVKQTTELYWRAAQAEQPPISGKAAGFTEGRLDEPANFRRRGVCANFRRLGMCASFRRLGMCANFRRLGIKAIFAVLIVLITLCSAFCSSEEVRHEPAEEGQELKRSSSCFRFDIYQQPIEEDEVARHEAQPPEGQIPAQPAQRASGPATETGHAPSPVPGAFVPVPRPEIPIAQSSRLFTDSLAEFIRLNAHPSAYDYHPDPIDSTE